MNASWFSHDSNARNSKKLIRLRQSNGAAGYGVYWMLVERLREEQDYTSDRDYDMLAFDLHVDTELIRSVIEDFGLFEVSEDGKFFHAPGLDERMELKDMRSAAGKKGAANRWGKNPDEMAQNGKNMANDDFANGIKEKKSKDKKKKEEKRDSSSSSYNPPSSSFAPSEVDEEKEKERILSEFFFKNWAAPNKELERFLAFNNTGGRCWSKMTDVEKQSALTLWRQEPEKPGRLSETFLSCWRELYNAMLARGTPIELRMQMLADGVRYKESGSIGIIICSRSVYEYMKSEMADETAAMRQALIAKRELTKLSYKSCPI